jgi:hypothetical protein
MAVVSGPWSGCDPEPGKQRRRGRTSRRSTHRRPLPVCPLCSITLARSTADLTLRLVVEGKAKRIPEGHQGSLHGIGLGLLEGGFMGLAQIHVNAVASAAPLADQRHLASGGDGDAHAGGVGDAPARLLVPARASGTDQSFGLGDAADGDRLALPTIEAKDAVRFRDHLPAFEVVDLRAALLPLADVGSIGGAERAASCSGEKPEG